jgi:hypothetical protein
MANATDLVRKQREISRYVVLTDSGTQITHIGVPLTVAGVIPLLWNMVVALQIWLRLRASIPPNLRKYYSLIMDPAAGQVTVVARTPTLSSPGQSMISGSEVSEKHSTEFVSWHLAIITGFLSQIGIPNEKLMQSVFGGGVTFAITRSKLLHRPWMSVIENCKFSIRIPDEIDDDQREEVRFTVQSDMKASDFTPLMMTWAHFVWVCLALDVSAFDPLWQSSIPCTIKDGRGKDLIKLFEDNDRLYARLLSGQTVTYVTHRTLAWYNIKFNGEVLFPLGCGTSSQVPISSVNISSELSAPVSLQTRAQKPAEKTLIGVVCGEEPQDCEHPLAAACDWVHYRRDSPPDWVTVSQRMLEYRQRILCYLKDLDDHKLLLGRLVTLMTPKSHQHDTSGPDDENGIKSHPDTTAVPKPLDAPKASKEPDVESTMGKTHVSEKADQETPARSISPTNENVSNNARSSESKTEQAPADGRMRTSTLPGAIVDTDAMARVGRKARKDTAGGSKSDRLVESANRKAVQVLEALRSIFDASAYVQRYTLLQKISSELRRARIKGRLSPDYPRSIRDELL